MQKSYGRKRFVRPFRLYQRSMCKLPPGGSTEAHMRIIVATFAGLLAAASVSAKTLPKPDYRVLAAVGPDALVRPGRPSLRTRPASGAPARLAGRLVVGSMCVE